MANRGALATRAGLPECEAPIGKSAHLKISGSENRDLESALMRIEVINTGTELLLGKVINSHLAYFGTELFHLGLRVDELSLQS